MSPMKEAQAGLKSPDETERIYAAEDIGYLNTADGVPILIDRLRAEPSRMVRDVIFQALIRIDADAAIEGAISLLVDEDPQIRNQSVDVLRHKGVCAVPFLHEAMRTGDKDVRKLVLDALSDLPAEDAVTVYRAALADNDLNILITALENIGRTRAKLFRPQIDDLLVAEAHPMLLAACMSALAELGEASSLVAIRRCFPNILLMPDFMVFFWLEVVTALGSTAEFLESAQLLAARGPEVYPGLVGAMLAIYPRCQFVPALESLVSDLRVGLLSPSPPLARYHAVRLLGFWDAEEAIHALLVSNLANDERLVRLGAAESLRTSGRAEVNTLLAARALEEDDEEILKVLHC